MEFKNTKDRDNHMKSWMGKQKNVKTGSAGEYKGDSETMRVAGKSVEFKKRVAKKMPKRSYEWKGVKRVGRDFKTEGARKAIETKNVKTFVKDYFKNK